MACLNASWCYCWVGGTTTFFTAVEQFLWHNFMLIKSVKAVGWWNQWDGGCGGLERAAGAEQMLRVKTLLWIDEFLNASFCFCSEHVCRQSCFSYLPSTCFHSNNTETILLIHFFVRGHSDNFLSCYGGVTGLRSNTVPVWQQQWHTIMLREEPVQNLSNRHTTTVG